MTSANLGAACDVSLKVTHTLLRKFFIGFERELEEQYQLKPEKSEVLWDAARSSRIEAV